MNGHQSDHPVDNLKHRELTDQIIAAYSEVHNELGFGYLESVYQNAMIIALASRGLTSQQEVPIPVSFRGHVVGNFEADVLVENKVILELKAVRAIVDAHKAQLMNYLRATNIEVGLLFNFGPSPEFKRLVLENSRKKNLWAENSLANLQVK